MKGTVDFFSPRKMFILLFNLFSFFFPPIPQLSEELENKVKASYDFVDYLFVFVTKMEVKFSAMFYIQTLSGTIAHYLHFTLAHHLQYFRTP